MLICRILLDLLSAKDVSENYYYFFLKFRVLEQGHLGNYIRERKLNIFFFFMPCSFGITQETSLVLKFLNLVVHDLSLRCWVIIAYGV